MLFMSCICTSTPTQNIYLTTGTCVSQQENRNETKRNETKCKKYNFFYHKKTKTQKDKKEREGGWRYIHTMVVLHEYQYCTVPTYLFSASGRADRLAVDD